MMSSSTRSIDNEKHTSVSHEASFNSSDSVSLLSLLASSDYGVQAPAFAKSHSRPSHDFCSIGTVKRMLPLASGSRGVSDTFMQKVFASKDSMFGHMDMMFGGMDSISAALPFHSFESISSDKRGTTGVKRPGDFQSKDWPNFAEEHMDINYSPNIFKTTEEPQPNREVTSKESSNWMAIYENTMGNPMEPMPELELELAFERIEEKPKKTFAPNIVEHKAPVGRNPVAKTFVERASHDILCGRGGEANLWEGNIRYRAVIEESKPKYNASAKYIKTLMSQEIVDQMKEEGRRFIKFDKDSEEWFLFPNLAARRKAGQALREENTAASRAAKRQRYRN